MYAALLAFLNVLASVRRALIFSRHLSLVTFTILAVFTYRNVWPLMTFTLRPKDAAEGDVLWVKLGLLAFVGVFLPLLEPYPYTPYDPSVGSQFLPLRRPIDVGNVYSSVPRLFPTQNRLHRSRRS